MKALSRSSWLPGALLGLVFTLLLSLEASGACGGGNLSDYCSTNFGLAGNVSAVSGRAASTNTIAELPSLPPAGALMYPDYVQVENEARRLLNTNMNFRLDLSPYQGRSNNFDEIVRRFDTAAGFNVTITDPVGLTMTLQQRIDKADNELRQARDLYAFLAVYAPEARFRQDSAYVGSPPNSPTALCGTRDKEDPDPPDPQNTGQVLPPVIDWCNFPARLRQAVREAAYLRMIFAQEFMVKALGLNFAADSLAPGSVDFFVRQEVAQLRAAVSQNDLAMQGLLEALDRSVGSGCLVSDFFTQAEWSILSRAMQGKELAQHHIAIRRSYLDIDSPDAVAQAQAAAQGEYRTAVADGYARLVNTAAQATLQPSGGCAKGTRPDGAVLADMAINLVDTRQKAREMAEGRNVFGFDIRFTPSRPYHTPPLTTDKGLWEQAWDSATLGKTLQTDAIAAGRAYDETQAELSSEITNLFRDVDNHVQMAAGCDYQTSFNYNTEEYVKCVNTMIEETLSCDPTADNFTACMNRTTDGRPPDPLGSNLVIPISDIRTSRQQLRVSYLGVKAAQQAVDNLKQRVLIEVDRNATVRSEILNNGITQSALDFIIGMLDSLSVEFGTDFTSSYNPSAPAVAAAISGKTIVQMMTDVRIENAESLAVQKNLLLDAAEAMVALSTAADQYQADLSDHKGVIGQTLHDLQEAQRMRAYLIAHPANDPAYRIVRDSKRLQLAKQLEEASRLAYLAARRAEFEYTARLSASNFRISDIYKARTADEIQQFLSRLEAVVQNLPGAVRQAEVAPAPITISVAQHILNLDDPATRATRFRQWVARNTTLEPDSQGVLKPVLRFTFNTSAANGGVLDRVQRTGYDFWWQHKMASMGINLLTPQTGLGFRSTRVSQQGQVQLRNFAGCIFDYRLIPPAALLGLDYPSNQPTDTVAGAFSADINGVNGQASGFTTPAFLSRPVAAQTWEVVIFGGSPNGILPDMDLQQLTDIELRLNTTHATRPSDAQPALRDCVRSDF